MTPEEIKLASECLYDKTYQCPVCEETFKEKSIRKGKCRTVSTDMDLDTHTEPIEQLYYDVIMCNSCGYTALSTMFDNIMEKQKMTVMQSISMNFKPRPQVAAYDLDMSLERYKLAYLVAVTKKAKQSELAYISMKISWHYKRKKDTTHELQYIQNAYNGFTSAYQTERFPICGIDEHTLNYLLANFASKLGKYDESLKLLSLVITQAKDNKRLFDRAQDLKENIKKRRAAEEEEKKNA